MPIYCTFARPASQQLAIREVDEVLRLPEKTQTAAIYSNRSLACAPFCRFGEEYEQDLSWREMEASSAMQLFFLSAGPNTIAFQSDKHPISERGLRRLGLAT
jgi:hypothetical protein